MSHFIDSLLLMKKYNQAFLTLKCPTSKGNGAFVGRKYPNLGSLGNLGRVFIVKMRFILRGPPPSSKM